MDYAMHVYNYMRAMISKPWINNINEKMVLNTNSLLTINDT